MTKFSPPQDITGEGISFGCTVDDGKRRVSAAGSAEHGVVTRASTTTVKIDERFKNDRRTSLKKDRRKSSLDLRKNIPTILDLEDGTAIMDDIKSDDAQEAFGGTGANHAAAKGCFQRFFLNPRYSLRRQMLLTFGPVSSLTILLVMIVSVIASIVTGNTLKAKTNVNVEDWVNEYTSTTTKFVADAITPKIMPVDLVDLLVEVVRDRFAGYPIVEDDSETPFYDTQSQTNIYPLQNDPLPLDWDFSHTPSEEGNVNKENAVEHVQGRWSWYGLHPRLSTAAALYHMQGVCNPLANSNALGYYPNCTGDNNDVNTGGVVAPNPTNEQVYRKGASLSPFLKALHESHQDIVSLGYYFGNSGAGSSVTFPHYELNSSGSYVSIGCDWMRADNPINSTLGPIGTEEEIARCHPEGAVVPTREYNPLERAWCRDQALNPGRIHSVGPYLNAFSAEKNWQVWTGRAVYDLVTSAFISCISVDFYIDGVNKILNDAKFDKLGVLTLVRNDADGTVVTSPEFDFETANATTTIDDPLLKTGVDLKMFTQIRNKVNFSQTWDPTNASSAFSVALSDSGGDHIVSAYPIPSVPKEYDPTYVPEFFVVLSVPKAKRLGPIVEKVEAKVDERVMSSVTFSVICGFVGLAVVILFICATSLWFVEPLNWMHKVGEQIVGKFGEAVDASIDHERQKSHPCSPKTELSKLVEEFNKIISHFSGEGTSKRMQMKERERMNLFDFSDDFAGLYRSRADSAFPFNYPKSAPASNVAEDQSIDHCHLGPNTRSSAKSSTRSLASGTHVHSRKPYTSPLFLWMVALIVAPTFLTNVIISSVVLNQISKDLPSLVTPVEEQYLALREAYRLTKTEILATRATGVAERAARDSHVLTRFASWLYFGGMKIKSGSFVELIEGAEECKTAPSGSQCEWAKYFPCDCAWNDLSTRNKPGKCSSNYFPGESRSLQKVHFECQSQDTSLDGSRNFTSFPAVAKYPNMTAWWDNTTVLLQSIKESGSSSHYDNTLDRTKIISALSTVFVPLYNYDKSDDKPMAFNIAFEADGMMAGYRGCDYDFMQYPFWRSAEKNGAAMLRPELCPLGKYGYDPRCRGWYHEGRKKAEAGNGTLHITSPYLFAEGNVVGQSATSPLVDPENNKHIGQVLVDFRSSTFKTLESDKLNLAEDGFPILITPESDVLGYDTVVGPGYSLEEGGKSIKDLLEPNDAFDNILRDMKAGKKGTGTFRSVFRNGPEEVKITFSPVFVRSYRPVNASDIARGVKNETTLVYSLALAEKTNGILKPFQSTKIFSSNTVNIYMGVLLALIIASTILTIGIAFRVTTSMMEPILQLLEVMKEINSKHISDDVIDNLSNHEGSCREVDSVYKTIEMLYKVVHIANSAFFSGDLEIAYQVLTYALRLFTRLDNKKAVAIASNNLGITMLTIYRTIKVSGSEEMCGLSKNDIIAKGTAYFTQSIKLGEAAYDQFYNEQGWSEECLAFMQFLANRYFNRAVFLLTTSVDNENRKDAEALGFRDLQITGDMDVEIVDQCLEMGFKINRVERYELMMSRIRGLLALAELGYNTDELFVEDQINGIYQDLKNALKTPSHELFKEMSAAGRMQKLDTELMKYFSQAKNDNANAARVAIRMLIEDEYIFPDAEQEAMARLLAYINAAEDENCPQDENGNIARELESAIESLLQEQAQQVTKVSSSMSVGLRASLVSTSLRISTRSIDSNQIDDVYPEARHRVSAMRQSAIADVTMELY